MYSDLIRTIREVYGDRSGTIPLHVPRMGEAEKRAVAKVIDSGFVSSVGPEVDEFERRIAAYCGARHAVAISNGTSALHVALLVAGVEPGDLVIVPSLSFVATANAVSYCGARPVFLDVDRVTLGLDPEAVRRFLQSETQVSDRGPIHRATGAPVAACVPMHAFGFPMDIHGLLEVCDERGIPVIEDAAESLGSYVGNRHTGTFGKAGVLSFNGNKLITGGNGGAILTDDPDVALEAKHLTTTAKLAHRYEYAHDRVGFNYRLPNLNAAFLLAQMDRLDEFLQDKRAIAETYAQELKDYRLFREREGTTANHWLSVLIADDRQSRDAILHATHEAGILTRPVWQPLHTLPMYDHDIRDGLEQTAYLADRIVNLPGTPRV